MKTFLCLFLLAISVRADDTALRATIVSLDSVKRAQPITMPKKVDYVKLLQSLDLEFSCEPPSEIDRRFIWAKYRDLPWIKLHAEGNEEENEAVRKLLAIN